MWALAPSVAKPVTNTYRTCRLQNIMVTKEEEGLFCLLFLAGQKEKVKKSACSHLKMSKGRGVQNKYHEMHMGQHSLKFMTRRV